MPETRFVYHAGAAGVGARIIRIDPPGTKTARNPVPNVDYVVPVQGTSLLPVTGGLSESTTGPFVYKVDKPGPLTILSVGRSSTRCASGYPGVRPFRVETEARATEISIIERITIRHMTVRLITVHGEDDPFPQVTPDCCVLDGLLLDGYPIGVKINIDPFCQFPTRQAMKENFQKLAKEHGPQFGVDPQKAREFPESKNRTMIATIVRDIDLGRNPPKGLKRTGINRIKWEGVGEIFLGAMLITDYDRRLTMVRVQLGSRIEGFAAVGDVQSNSGPVLG